MTRFIKLQRDFFERTIVQGMGALFTPSEWGRQVKERTGCKAEAMAAYKKALDAEPNYLWVSRVLIPALQKTE